MQVYLGDRPTTKTRFFCTTRTFAKCFLFSEIFSFFACKRKQAWKPDILTNESRRPDPSGASLPWSEPSPPWSAVWSPLGFRCKPAGVNLSKVNSQPKRAQVYLSAGRTQSISLCSKFVPTEATYLVVGNKWRIRGSFETEHQPVGIWMKQLIITFKLSRWFKMSCGHVSVWAAIDLRRNSAKAAATQESRPAYLTFKWLKIAQNVDVHVLSKG